MKESVKEPHAHDVLSGRGNFVNYHDGNEYFRKLVRKHKLEYVNCPKQQKGKFSKLIVDAIKARNPPGRFLKQDKDSKLWYDIGEKKALDKTRQALREGAPELMNNGTSKKDSEATFNQGNLSNNQLNSSEYDMLQQSIMSLGNDSMTQNFSPGGLMSRNTFNNNVPTMSMGLSPDILNSPIYSSPGMVNGGTSNAVGVNQNNSRLGNGGGGIDISQMIPPPQLHQSEQRNSLQEQQLQQLRLLQQQKQQQQQQQQQFTSQQEQQILRNANAVMGADFMQQRQSNPQQQLNPTKIHMDQLRINRLKEKRKLLEQQIMHQRQLEILELKKLQNQQKLNEFQQQQQNPSEMRGALQSRLGAVYAGTEAMLEPTPLATHTQPLNDSSEKGDNSTKASSGMSSFHNSGDNTGSGRRGIVRENSLKMESIFEDGNKNTGSTGSNKTKKYDASNSGMSITSLSLGFEEESELSALFDTSMKIERGGDYTTALNDRQKQRHGKANNKAELLGMSLATITAEKSNSSMSYDSSLNPFFDDSGGSGK